VQKKLVGIGGIERLKFITWFLVARTTGTLELCNPRPERPTGDLTTNNRVAVVAAVATANASRTENLGQQGVIKHAIAGTMVGSQLRKLKLPEDIKTSED
jgi:hypothetical protein